MTPSTDIAESNRKKQPMKKPYNSRTAESLLSDLCMRQTPEKVNIISEWLNTNDSAECLLTQLHGPHSQYDYIDVILVNQFIGVFE